MNMTQNTNDTVPSRASLPPDTRTNIEKLMDAENGKTWADVHAAEDSAPQSQNLAESFDPSATLRALMDADDEPGTQRPAPEEDGVPLTDGALRILELAQNDGLTDAERKRLDAAEHRADLDRALDLAVKNTAAIAVITGTVTVDADTAMKGSKLLGQFFNDGRRDFTAEENDAMQYALDTATRTFTLSDDPQVNEKHRRQQIAELQVVAAAIADGTATRGQRIRWSRFNTSGLLNALKTTRWVDLPLDLVRNF